MGRIKRAAYQLITSTLLIATVTQTALAGTVTYYISDAIGSVAMEMDDKGSPTSVYDYRPYGESKLDASTPGPGYAGHIHEFKSGLIYMGARYYDPTVGQFLSADPYGASTGNLFSVNRYNYASNNPYKYNDPDGRLPFLALFGLFMAGGAAAVHSDYANAPASENENQSLGLIDHLGALPGLNASKGVTSTLSIVQEGRKVARTAEEAADLAKAAGKAQGAASDLSKGNKVIAVGVSGEDVPHTNEVLGALMGARGTVKPWHGGCAEIVCLNKAISSGIDPRGGVMRTVNISSDAARHNTPKAPCSSCANVLQHFGVRVGN